MVLAFLLRPCPSPPTVKPRSDQDFWQGMYVAFVQLERLKALST